MSFNHNHYDREFCLLLSMPQQINAGYSVSVQIMNFRIIAYEICT